MFKQYIKDHEMTMRIEHKNIFKSMLSKQRSTIPFLTSIYQRQNKDTDLLDFLLCFDKCMSQLIEDKKVIISILQEIEVAEENINDMWVLSSLRDLSLFALAESTLEKKYLIKRIMAKYNL